MNLDICNTYNTIGSIKIDEAQVNFMAGDPSSVI